MSNNWRVRIFDPIGGGVRSTRFVETDTPISVKLIGRGVANYNEEAVLKHVYQELNGHEEAVLRLGNNAANRTLVQSDRDVIVEWLGGSNVFSGLLTGGSVKRGLIEPYVYEKVAALLDGEDPFSGSYANVAADVILADILQPPHVYVGECPTTLIKGVTFVEANRLTSAIFLSELLRLDYWPSNGNTFNIGNRGKCYLHLKFNEGTGSIINDSSGYENNFTPVGIVNWTTLGKFGNGYSFNSSNYTTHPDKIITTTESFTIVLFIDPTTLTGTRALCRRGTGTYPEWYIHTIGDEIQFGISCGTTDCRYTTNNANLLVAEGYIRVICVYDAGTKTAKIYVRGVECTYSLEQQGVGTETDADVLINFGTHIGITGFHGFMDEVQFFQRALDAKEASALTALQVHDIPERGIDRSKARNHALVQGTGPDGGTLYGEAYVDSDTGIIVEGAPPGGFNKKSIKFQEKKVSLPTELNKLAAMHLKKALLESSGVRVYTAINNGYPLEPGDYAVIEDENLLLADVYRIQARKVTLALVELEIDKMVSKTDSTLTDLTKYEELGIYTTTERGRIGGGAPKVVRLIGESESGYNIYESGTGQVSITKDLVNLLITGPAVGRAQMQSTSSVNFDRDPSLIFRVDRTTTGDPDERAWLGLWNAATTKGIFVYIDGAQASFIVYNGPGNTSSIAYGTLGSDYTKFGMFKRGSSVHCYADDVYFGSIDTNVPITGSTIALYLDFLTDGSIGSSISMDFDIVEVETLW